MTEEKKTVDLGLLDEDDAFEEFPTEEWDTKEEDQSDVNVWEDNWDDDTVEDDFSVQLSKINRKRSLSSTSPMISTEPSAKKVCVAATNGHYKNDVVMADAVGGAPNGDSKVHQSSPSPSRRGRTARLSSASKTDEENENRREQTPPSRASARLRSSRK